jgi:hypothetical protein
MSHLDREARAACFYGAGGSAYESTFQSAGDSTLPRLQGQHPILEVGPPASLDLDALVEQILHCLGRATRCFASGLLLVEGHRGQVTLHRARPVDDLFLRAMQQRIVSNYRVCVGPAVVEPEMEVKVLGDAVPGPYEPPRSLLATPILRSGRVVGMIAVASVFREAFRSRDLCILSAVAAQASAALSQAYPHSHRDVPEDVPAVPGAQPAGEISVPSEGQLWSQVGHYLASICDLANQWQAQGRDKVPDALVQDLGEIVEHARQIRDLLAC